jgi:hypothetical protein
LLALGALMLLGGTVQAQQVLMIPASEAVGPPASTPGKGLNGAWYSDPANPTQAIPNIAAAQAYMSVVPPEGTFTATQVFWCCGDQTDINAFLDYALQKDASTLTPPVMQPIRSSIFDLTGFLNITASDLNPVIIALASDDGSAFYVGMPGTYDYTLALNDGTHGTTKVQQMVQFEAPGLYPIEIIYFNQDYMNGQGGAAFNLFSTLDGSGVILPSRFYNTATP